MIAKHLTLIISLSLAVTVRATSTETNQTADGKANSDIISIGKQIVDKKKCAICHALDGKGGMKTMKPLNGITEGKTDEYLRGSLLRPKEVIDPKTKMPAYKLEEKEVEAVIEYMKTLKAPASPKS